MRTAVFLAALLLATPADAADLDRAAAICRDHVVSIRAASPPDYAYEAGWEPCRTIDAMTWRRDIEQRAARAGADLAFVKRVAGGK